MKVKIQEEDGKEYSLDELFEEWEQEQEKMNFLWKYLDKKYPKGLAGYNTHYALTHPWLILEECCNQVKWAWQRVFRKWDERVVWSIDYYLAEMIPQWITALKTAKHGVPCCVFDGECDSNGEYTKEQWKNATEKYNGILDDIIIGFQSHLEMDNYSWSDPKRKELENKLNKAFDLLKEYYGTFWD